MKKNLNILSALLLSSLAFVGCQDNKPKEGGELIEQAAVLYDYVGSTYNKANAFNVNAIDLEEADVTPVTKNFKVEFVKPVLEDTEVYMSVSKSAAMQYMKTTGKKYEILPSSLVKLPTSIKVAKGEMQTPEMTFSVDITKDIKLNTPYIFAITLDGASHPKCDNINVFASNNTIVYTLLRREETTEITRVTSLKRDVFFDLEQKFPMNLPNGMTMECLINVGKFRGGAGDAGDAGISTLMGIEGKCLLRFGDAGVEPNMLQACGEVVPFKFSTNKWYHIAAVFTPSKRLIIYIDGNKMGEYIGKPAVLNAFSADDWYIARSYNGNRGIIAKFAEVRVWDTARSQSEIQNSIYGVPENTPNLLAYWKMDKAQGAKVIDVTGNGYDLILKQQDSNKEANVEVVTESSPVEL